MAMDQMPPQAPPPQDMPDAPAPGGAAELVAGIGSDMMKLADMVGAKFPEEAQKLHQIIDAYKGFAESLTGADPGQQQGPPSTTSMEAGANPNARPAGM